MAEHAWWQEIERPQDASLPAAHWVALYSELERTLAAIALESPDARSRLSEIRRRLRHWELESRRTEAPAAARR